MGEAVRAVRVRLIGCVLGAVVAVVAAAGLGAAPAHAYTCPGNPSPVWGCPEFGAGKYDGLFNWRPSVTVIGDSLIQLLDENLANQLTSAQFWGHTTGIGGSSFFHWNNEINGRDLYDWVGEFSPKHSVIALGTNDASKLGSDPNVTRADIRAQIGWGMERAWQATQRCVIVVGPSRHTRRRRARDTCANRWRSSCGRDTPKSPPAIASCGSTGTRTPRITRNGSQGRAIRT